MLATGKKTTSSRTESRATRRNKTNLLTPDQLDRLVRDAIGLFSQIALPSLLSLLKVDNIRFTEDVPTAAIHVTRDRQVVIEISPTFVSTYARTTQAFAGVLLHEVLHHFLGHLRSKMLRDTSRNQIAVNIAMDAVIQSIIRSLELKSPASVGLCDSFRKYYDQPSIPVDAPERILRPNGVHDRAENLYVTRQRRVANKGSTSTYTDFGYIERMRHNTLYPICSTTTRGLLTSPTGATEEEIYGWVMNRFGEKLMHREITIPIIGSDASQRGEDGRGTPDSLGEKKKSRRSPQSNDSDRENEGEKESDGDNSTVSDDVRKGSSVAGSGNPDEHSDDADAASGGGDGDDDSDISDMFLGDDPMKSFAKQFADDLRSAVGAGGGLGRLIDAALEGYGASHATFDAALRAAMLENIKNRIVAGLVVGKTIRRSPVVPARIAAPDLLKLSGGLYPVFFTKANTNKVRGRVVVYMDVSGSALGETASWLAGLLDSVRVMYDIDLFLFSTFVIPWTLDQLREGKIKTSYGTSFNAVIEHFLEQPEARRAIIVTDGFDSASYDLADKLKESGKTMVGVVVDKSSCNVDRMKTFCEQVFFIPIDTLRKEYSKR